MTKAGKYIPPLNEKWLNATVERVENSKAGRPVDRVGFSPRMIGFGGGVITFERGIHNYGEFYRNPTLAMEGSLFGEQMLDMDIYSLWRWANFLEACLGTEVEIRDSGQVIPTVTPFNEVEDVENFEVPSEQKMRKNWEVVGELEAMAAVERLTDNKYKHTVYNYDPTQCSGVSCKTADLFFYWVAGQPDIAKQLIKKTSQTWMRFTDIVTTDFPDVENRDCWMASVMSSNDILSPDQWMEFYYPYAIDMQAEYLSKKGLKKINFHPCGAHWPNEKAGHWKTLFSRLKKLFPTWRAVFGWPTRWKLWDIDPAANVRKYPDVCWWGPLDVHEYMVPTPKEVYEITKKYILECGNAPGGYMVGTACETGPAVSEANLSAVVQACKDWGKRDKNGELIAKEAKPP